MKYGMLIDLNGCIGCQVCAMACKMAHNLPTGIWRNRVLTVGGSYMDTASGEYPDVDMHWMPISCQHCTEPRCLDVCPTGATSKDEQTGIVRVDTQACIGCESCIAACPYDGVRQLIDGEPQYEVEAVFGYEDEPPAIANTVQKCDFCYNRIVNGETPACMELCPGRVRLYGDLDDPNSEIAQKIAEADAVQLLADQGTNPSVYYIDYAKKH